MRNSEGKNYLCLMNHFFSSDNNGEKNKIQIYKTINNTEC